MIRTILTEGDPVLNKKAHPVTRFDEKLWNLLEDMKDTLLQSNGAGLAAPQIGILRRVVLVIDGEDRVIELINPSIVSSSGEQEGLEGCLSVPGKWAFLKRPMTVRVRAQDRNGEWFEAEDSELTARCFCHELEHLDGHLFVEHADRLYTTEEIEQMESEDGK